MISLDDPRWPGLRGGYRMPYDPRPALRNLEEGRDIDAAWKQLWNELHHQGDVGEASYAAVPHLVRIHAKNGIADWNTYAMVATVEDARRKEANPLLPSWLSESYESALRKLAELGLEEFRNAERPELVNSIIAVLTIARGQPLLARLAAAFTDDERKEILVAAGYC
jgi:hypothetical protein